MYPISGLTVGGGVSRAVSKLTKAVSKVHPITIVAGYPSAFAEPNVELELPGVDFSPVRMRSKLYTVAYGLEFVLRSTNRIRKVVKSKTIIHGHSGHPLYALATLCGKHHLMLPSVHTLYCSPDSWNHGQAYVTLLLKRLDRVVVLSKRSFAWLRDHGLPESKIRRIPPAVDFKDVAHEVDQETAKAQLGLTNKYPVLFFAGNNLLPEKGSDIALGVLARVLVSFPKAHLIIAVLRNDAQDGFIRLLGELRLVEKVTLLGPVPRLAVIIAAADFVVAPFRSITTTAEYPLTLLEAMALGKPVLCTALDSIKEFIEDGSTGYLCALDGPEPMAARLKELAANKERAQAIGREASRYVRQHFGVEPVLRQHMALYRELAESSAEGGNIYEGSNENLL